MSSNPFSVHKSTIISNRKALALYLINQNRGAEVPAIMSQLIDLDAASLAGNWGDRVPLSVVTDDINLAAEILQDDFLGLKIIELIDLPYLPLYRGIKQCLDPFIRNNTVIPIEVISRLIVRYFKVATEAVQVRIEPSKDTLRILFESSVPEHISIHQMDGVMLGVQRIMQAFHPQLPVRLGLSLRSELMGDVFTESTEVYKQFFKLLPVKSTRNYLEFSVPQLGQFEINQFCISPLQNILDKEFPQSSYVERCQHILTTTMSIMEPTREQVSLVLNMSVSTLQRRLKQEGSSFHGILLSTRKKLANEYLIQQKLSAKDVAFFLGYQSESQFFKAFKNWFGMTPMAYQKLNL
ncbi:MAG: helix-turn-helix transcriptional regulator [Oleispira sp.]